MLKYKKIKSKKGQIGGTLTWLAATLIIIGILFVFLFFSILMSKFKDIGIGDVRTDLPKESAVLNMKTFLANQLANNRNKELIESILKENG